MTTETLAPPTAFRSFILRTAQLTMDGLQSAPPTLPTDVRDQALHTLSFCFRLEDSWQLTRDILLNLAPKMELMGHRYDWIPYLEQGVESSQQRKDLQSQASFQFFLGQIYRLLGDFANARKLVVLSLEYFKNIPDSPEQVGILNELSWIELLLQDFAASRLHADRARQLLIADSIEHGMNERVLGQIAFAQNLWQEAEFHFRTAITIFERFDDQRKIAWNLQNLGNALKCQSKFEEAIECYNKAATSLMNLHDEHHWARVQLNLGTTYCDYQQPEIGFQHYQQAYRIFQKLSDKLEMARTNTGLGLAFFSLKRYDEAKLSFRVSVEQFDILNQKNWSLNAADGLAMSYLATHDYEQALDVLNDALLQLPQISQAPNYSYLKKSLNQHLQQALEGKSLSIKK